MIETQVSSFRTGKVLKGPKRNIIYARRDIITLKNVILRNYRASTEDFSSLSRKHSRNKDPAEEKSKKDCTNQLFIQSPVYQDHPQALPTQTAPGQTSETEWTYQIPSCSNSAEYQDSSTQAMIIDESTEASCNEEDVQPEQVTENESLASMNSRENGAQSYQSLVMNAERTTTGRASSTKGTDLLTDEKFVDKADQPADSISDIRIRWRCQLADILDEVDNNISYTCIVTSELHQSFVRSSTAIKNLCNSLRNKRVKEVGAVKPKDVTVGDKEPTSKDKNEGIQGEKKKEEFPDEDKNDDDRKCGDGKAKNSQDANDDGDDGDSKSIEDDEDKEAPKKTRGNLRSFVLPAEYDSNDTRWTLKYHEGNSKLGIVEILPRTKVYINSIKLSHCKRVAKDSKTLARMLLVEIFSQTALSVCSLTGARANAFDISGMKVRPGLDEHARMVILNFVEEHARRKNWGVFDSQSVINSIRSKIQEMRAKYGQTA